MFVDRVQIEVQGGRGGNGCVSFRREKYVPHGGPDGGDGGDGGSVILVARAGVNNLAALAHHKFWRARSGQHGSGSNRAGKSADDLVIEVPPGTTVLDVAGSFVLKDLVQEGDQVVAARGGSGGKGNAAFKSATNRVPREVIADVGLIGKPNAGKSTLLSRLTRARPEIADYPFTTKHPNLGIVTLDIDRQFVLADIPGLIEGAHAGAGLGHEFLRHIERSGILVHLVEPAPVDGSDPLANYATIRDELVRYDPQLGARPEIVAMSKCELPGAAEVHKALVAASGKEVLLISAVTGQGLNQLTQRIAAVLAEQKQP
jgi:GTP-binding protein